MQRAELLQNKLNHNFGAGVGRSQTSAERELRLIEI